ncbi:DUF2892 domain-containing protein [uncultured Desulfosarcina sp.]|uniref:YgaP family membrane protein n=1 Tax=uncultured Desulfosarcina sp. TaxID=218289 RepID=UPI0029C898A7|nr:DUF2892 domain-containing protein [uncultured Desulfosarcina sp.]
MKSNVGRTERIVRIIAGLVFFVLGAGYWWGFYWIAAVVFFTGLISWCPIWSVLKISSCKDTEEEEIPVNSVSTDKDKRIRERRFK